MRQARRECIYRSTRSDAFHKADPFAAIPDGSHQYRITERITGTITRLRGDLVEAIEQGEIAPIDPDMAMTYLWGSWSGVLALSLRDAPLTVPKDYVRDTLQRASLVLVRGLTPNPAPLVLPRSAPDAQGTSEPAG